MDLFSFLKPVLHQLDAEKAHGLAVKALACGVVPVASPAVVDDRLAVDVAGLKLPNPVGLAAGFDKNAHTLAHVFSHGFGFAECGTVTPKPQAGNPKPRVFRVPELEGVINRLGFNNDGLEPFVQRLQQRPAHGMVGANIGKNKDSADAVADYVTGLKAVYAYADYVTVNISSPNTQGLRDLQAEEALVSLVKAVHEARDELMAQGAVRKPILVKIAPDLDAAQCEVIADIALTRELDGLIVSNTTIARPGMSHVPEHLQQGGLSGKPLMELSTHCLREMYRLTNGKVPLIGVGGIASASDAVAKFKAGASAVQLYSALVYQGLGLVNAVNRGVLAQMERDGVKDVAEWRGVEN